MVSDINTNWILLFGFMLGGAVWLVILANIKKSAITIMKIVNTTLPIKISSKTSALSAVNILSIIIWTVLVLKIKLFCLVLWNPMVNTALG